MKTNLLRRRRAINAQLPARMNPSRYFAEILTLIEEHEHNEIGHADPREHAEIRDLYEPLKRETARRLAESK